MPASRLIEAACHGCDGRRPATFIDAHGAAWCEPCYDRHIDEAHARIIEDFYGGSSAVTWDEQCAEGAREKHRW